jgi:hypothetical protein
VRAGLADTAGVNLAFSLVLLVGMRLFASAP